MRFLPLDLDFLLLLLHFLLFFRLLFELFAVESAYRLGIGVFKCLFVFSVLVAAETLFVMMSEVP